jgi:lipoprotein-releasing system permease protein
MRLPHFIAKRYLFAKKSHNVINIISFISMAGIVVGSMGLIIVLSVFNGFGDLVISLYNSFDPDIRITAVEGKTFDPAKVDVQKIAGVKSVTLSLEESALIKYGDQQFIATIKGVDSSFLNATSIRDKIVDGKPVLESGENNFAITGSTIAYYLSLSLDNPFNVLNVYVPKKGKPVSLVNPEEAFNNRVIRPSGVFAIQQDFDSKYVLVPLRFARDIIGEPNRVSSMEIMLHPGTDAGQVAAAIQQQVGGSFKAETRLQQHAVLYRILKFEKWAVYMILTFIIIIAVFNIIGSLSILIIEKKKDIGILRSLGANTFQIRNIFISEGVLITMIGALTGMTLGALVCFLQQEFGLIKLENAASFVIDSYPVAMKATDFAGVFLTVFVIGAVASLYTSRKLIPTAD